MFLLALLAGAGWMVYHAPVLTLDYVRALVWPIVALVLVLSFRSSIRRVFQDVVLRRLEGFGGRAEFEPRPTDQHVQAPADFLALREAVARDEVPDGEPRLFEDPCHEVQEALDNQTQLSQQLLVLLTIFDTQLDLLTYLQAAPNGVEPRAVEVWLARAKQQRPAAAELNSDGLLRYLTAQSLVQINEAGNYALTDAGNVVLAVNANLWHAPKLM